MIEALKLGLEYITLECGFSLQDSLNSLPNLSLSTATGYLPHLLGKNILKNIGAEIGSKYHFCKTWILHLVISLNLGNKNTEIEERVGTIFTEDNKNMFIRASRKSKNTG